MLPYVVIHSTARSTGRTGRRVGEATGSMETVRFRSDGSWEAGEVRERERDRCGVWWAPGAWAVSAGAPWLSADRAAAYSALPPGPLRKRDEDAGGVSGGAHLMVADNGKPRTRGVVHSLTERIEHSVRLLFVL